MRAHIFNDKRGTCKRSLRLHCRRGWRQFYLLYLKHFNKCVSILSADNVFSLPVYEEVFCVKFPIKAKRNCYALNNIIT